MKEKITGMMGLCVKAGKMIFGSEACDKAIKSAKARLIVVDGGASQRTKKAFKDACAHYRVPLIISGELQNIGERLGKPASMVFGITSADFAETIIKINRNENPGV